MDALGATANRRDTTFCIAEYSKRPSSYPTIASIPIVLHQSTTEKQFPGTDTRSLTMVKEKVPSGRNSTSRNTCSSTAAQPGQLQEYSRTDIILGETHWCGSSSCCRDEWRCQTFFVDYCEKKTSPIVVRSR
jgi:hypothetical protein